MSYAMGNQSKIKQIQEKKKRVRDRIQKLQQIPKAQPESLKLPDLNQNGLVPTYEQKMAQLLQKKKKLEEEKEKQFRYKKMQEEYIERRKQAQREKRLEQISNQKRMLQLEVGMKRVVFEGVKQKVRGSNSEQLMIRAMMRDQNAGVKPRGYTSKGNIRRDFQKFLEVQEQRNIKEKWDVYQLNEKRFEIFQKKQQTYMRQILLKEMISQGKQQELNVLELTRQQLQQKLDEYGLSLEDWIQNYSKEEVIKSLPELQKNSLERIQKYKKLKNEQDEEFRKLQHLKAKTKQQLLLKPSDLVKMMRSLVYNIIDATVFDYQKRINRFKISEIPQLKSDLEDKYKNVLLDSENYEYSKVITLKLLEKIHQQFFIQTAQEMSKLNNFTHDKTQQCFAWMFGQGGKVGKKLKDIDGLDIPLNFEDESDPNQEPKKQQKNELKKQNYLSKFQDYTNNIFDVDKLTTELINEVNLLDIENQYFQNIFIKIYNEKSAPDSSFHILYDRQLYVIMNEGVFNSRKSKKLQPLGIKDKLEILHWDKFHNFWIIHDPQKISIYSPWSLQILPNQIGERISSNCGKITSFAIFPVFSFSGGICAIMLGFQKGHILKYNLNLNRITNSQTNVSIYSPILPQVKTGNQPPFPLDKKKFIPIDGKSKSESMELHQFREFFDHHSSAIIGIIFHKFNSFISVDKNMRCAIWVYDERQGAKCYKPAYQFQFVCSYHVYKEADNSRYREIYPGNSNDRQKPEDMYEKWMQTQGYLKKQIYNNPKNMTAYFRTADSTEEKGETPLWKINYDNSRKKVIKINQSYYNSITGRMEGKSVKLWRQYLLVLCEREHPIRDDLKTIKIYGWDVQDRKMRSIGIEFDVYKTQKKINFEVLDNMLVGVELHLIAVVSSGRILIFSLLSGQLLRNISDPQYLENSKFANTFFIQITSKRSYLAAATKNLIAEISFNDKNKSKQQKELNEIVEQAQKKYINLL